MEAFEAISKRASVREYTPEEISKDLLTKLVDAGRRAPTARGIEPWEFVVVTDRKMLEKLGKIANTGPFIKDAFSCIAVFSKDTKYYLEDGSAATENILIASAALGLGACWIAGDKKLYAEEISKLLGAAPNLKLVSLIPVGKPRTEPKQNKARSLDEVLHWERF